MKVCDFDLPEKLGSMVGQRWREDPKGLCFTLARYKHVAKMLDGKDHVLEVGCGDGFGTRIVRQHVNRVTAIDSDEKMISDTEERRNPAWDIDFQCADLLYDGVPEGTFDAVFCLDVYEHVEKDRGPYFLSLLAKAAPVAIVGCPSLESQPYASERSRACHINCKTAVDLKKQMLVWFRQVFMFGIQDETLTTGFDAMRQYHLALGVR